MGKGYLMSFVEVREDLGLLIGVISPADPAKCIGVLNPKAKGMDESNRLTEAG